MSKAKNLPSRVDIGYLPATLQQGKDGYRVVYYVINPMTDKFVRRRIRVDKVFSSYKKKRDALIHIGGIIENINAKLRSGCNPFFDGEDSRLYVKLSDVCESFLKEKKKELRPDTIRSYSSFITLFLGFCNRLNAKITASLVTKIVAVKFMDYVWTERNVSARSYNNYLKYARSFFNWCVLKGYAKENPFLQLKIKRKEEKQRIIIDMESREQITHYLSKTNPGLLLVCNLIYSSLIRPKEIRNVKVSDVDIAGHFIKLRGDITKNHKTRYAAITQETENLIREMKLLDLPDTYYLMGNDYRPNMKQMSHTRMGKDWQIVRKALRLPTEMQLYSFRDTGITEMLRSGIPDITVMQHAGHSDLSITSIYANHFDTKQIEKIRTGVPDF